MLAASSTRAISFAEPSAGSKTPPAGTGNGCRCVLYCTWYPATCSRKGPGSGSTTAVATAVGFSHKLSVFLCPQTGIAGHSRAPRLSFSPDPPTEKKKPPNRTDCSAPLGSLPLQLLRGRLKPLLVLHLARTLPLLGDRGLVLRSLGSPCTVDAAISHRAAPVSPTLHSGIGLLVRRAADEVGAAGCGWSCRRRVVSHRVTGKSHDGMTSHVCAAAWTGTWSL